MILSALIHQMREELAAAGIDNPDLDTRILIAHALNLDRAQLLSQSDRILTNEETHRIEALIARRARHEPVARILGSREFWSLSFALNEATLVPRPESETLIEAALEKISSCHPRVSGDPAASVRERETTVLSASAEDSYTRRRASLDSRLRGNDRFKILDLGTGSGCLLLALLHEIPGATGLGVDIAPRAVEQAKENAENLGLADRAEFRVNNWADGITERFDIIVSNPPYIARNEIPTLMPDVRDYDPFAALDGGEDGLDPYRLLIPQLPKLLKPNGLAIFEIGEKQAESVSAFFQETRFAKIEIRRDLADITRCVMGSGLPLPSPSASASP